MTVRVGIVGAGFIAGVHSAAYRAAPGSFPATVPGVQLVHVADADRVRARALASAWGWQRAGGEWEAVTRADDIDVVDVCTPNHLHAEVAIDALRHGKHVVCEKPLASDLAEASEMAAVARASGRLAQVCFYYRTWPAIVRARELVDAGRIGRAVHLRGRMLQDYAADPAHGLGWRAGGAGALDDLGSHILDVARFLVGDVGALIGTTRARASGTVDGATAVVEFAGGATGTIEAGWTATGHGCDLGFDLMGDAGAVRFDWERANELQVRERGRHGFERSLIDASYPGAAAFVGVPGQQMGYRDAFTLGLAQLLGAVAEGRRTVAPSFEDGLRVAQVVAAIATSSAQRRWVAVDSKEIQ